MVKEIEGTYYDEELRERVYVTAQSFESRIAQYHYDMFPLYEKLYTKKEFESNFTWVRRLVHPYHTPIEYILATDNDTGEECIFHFISFPGWVYWKLAGIIIT